MSGDLSFIKQKETCSWTKNEVADWLQFIDLSEYKRTFLDNCITGQELVDLDNQDLAMLGVRTLGHRKRILKQILNLINSNFSDSDGSGSNSETSSNSGSVSSSGSNNNNSSKKHLAKNLDEVPCKCYYKKKVAVVTINNSTSLNQLKRKIKREFGRSMTLKYEDQDGELIPLKKDRDLKTAVKYCYAPIRITCTRRKRGTKKETLSEAETNLMDSIIDAMVVIDMYGNVLFINKATEDLFGYTKKEVIGENVKMLMPPIYAKKHDKFLFNYRKTGKKSVIGKGREVVAVHSNGTNFPIHLSLSETKNENRHIVTGTIRPSQNDNIEEELESLREVDDPVIVINSSGVISLFNDAASDIFGFSADEVIGENVSILMPSPHKENHDYYLSNYLKTGKKKVIGKTREVIIEKNDGTIVPVYLSIEEKVDSNGGKLFIGMISKRESKKPVNFLRRERDVINNLTVPAILINDKGTIQAFNEEAGKFIGYDMSEVLGRNVKMLMTAEHSDNHDQYLKNYLETGVAKIIGVPRVLEAQHKNGTAIPFKLTVTERKDGDNTYFVGMFHSS